MVLTGQRKISTLKHFESNLGMLTSTKLGHVTVINGSNQIFQKHPCNKNLFSNYYKPNRASLVAQMVTNLPPSTGDRFHHWVRKIPWKKERLPTPIFLPGEFHGQRSLVGYSPWGCKKLDTTEQLSLYWRAGPLS